MIWPSPLPRNRLSSRRSERARLLPVRAVEDTNQRLDAILKRHRRLVHAHRGGGTVAHVRLDPARVESHARQPGVLEVQLTHEVVGGGLAQAVAEEGYGKGLHLGNRSDGGGNDEKARRHALLQQRGEGLDQVQGAQGVDFELVADGLGGRLQGRCDEGEQACVGDQDVDVADRVLGLELLDCCGRVRVDC